MRACTVVLGALVFLSPLSAQQAATADSAEAKTTEWPRGSSGSLRFFVDAALFRGVQGFALQEFYTLLDARQLQFVPEGGNFVAQIDLALTITDSNGQIAGEETRTRNLSVPDLHELRETGAFVRDQIGFSLKPGDYQVTCEVEDVYGDTQGGIAGPLHVDDFETSGLISSGVRFASSFAPSETEGRFVRNGWEVVPRITRIYKTEEPVRFYHELYNLSPGSDPGAFDVRYQLLDEDNVPVAEAVDRRFKKGGESAVLMDSIATTGLPVGQYALEVQSLDLDGKSRTRRVRTFFLQSDEETKEELSEDQKTSLAYYRHIKWVAEEADLKAYKSLKTLESKDKFLKVFWKRVDPSPGTAVNEKLIEHIRRMRFSDNNFSGSHKQEGYDTQKARVYVKYGPPSERDYRSAVDSVKPCEVWTYEEQGMYEFIFRDRRGIGVYELVHSTFPGELYNPNWQNEI
jgi:GWxTD domain-containing protein